MALVELPHPEPHATHRSPRSMTPHSIPRIAGPTSSASIRGQDLADLPHLLAQSLPIAVREELVGEPKNSSLRQWHMRRHQNVAGVRKAGTRQTDCISKDTDARHVLISQMRVSIRETTAANQEKRTRQCLRDQPDCFDKANTSAREPNVPTKRRVSSSPSPTRRT